MPDKPTPPSLKRIAATGLAFAVATLIGEMTFGNADFPLTVWYFEKIAAWQWSLPVHLAGFIWVVICNRLFLSRSVLVPILLGICFFFIGEVLNWYFLGFFAYAGDQAFEKAISFWVIIAMYAGLCSGAVLLLRFPGRRLDA